MDLQEEVERLKALLKTQEEIGTELDRRVFHLKTLYDVSKDIYGIVEIETILRNFLLMTMGNFGAYRGFILLLDAASSEILHFVNLGFREDDTDLVRSAIFCLSEQSGFRKGDGDRQNLLQQVSLPSSVLFSIPFVVNPEVFGLMGLGTKLVGHVYSEGDRELITTLVNNLVVALKNAKSFEEIQRLNMDLEAKNIELEKTLKQLTASLRKIEILESVKANLSKFVPATVTRYIDRSPTGSIPELEERDVSVLFLDIEGYTGLCERLGHALVHDIVEKHFSVFMDAIYANNGDVNETAGDGLMVLYMNKDTNANALEAVRTALTIREQSVKIKEEFIELYRPLDVNMGINSGPALVGAAKFETLTGARWTYTARGSVVNVAARIGALARKGGVFMSKATADRIVGRYSPSPKGKYKLKNVSEEVAIFEL